MLLYIGFLFDALMLLEMIWTFISFCFALKWYNPLVTIKIMNSTMEMASSFNGMLKEIDNCHLTKKIRWIILSLNITYWGENRGTGFCKTFSPISLLNSVKFPPVTSTAANAKLMEQFTKLIQKVVKLWSRGGILFHRNSIRYFRMQYSTRIRCAKVAKKTRMKIAMYAKL